MIGRIGRKLLDWTAGALFRFPPIYNRLRLRLTNNPQALYDVLSDGRVISRVSAQTSFLAAVADHPKAAAKLASAPAFVEHQFSSKMASEQLFETIGNVFQRAAQGDDTPEQQKAERFTQRLFGTISEQAPETFLIECIQKHDGLLETIIFSKETAASVVKNAAKHKHDLKYTKAQRESIYALFDAMEAAQPEHVNTEYFEPMLSKLTTGPLKGRLLSRMAEDFGHLIDTIPAHRKTALVADIVREWDDLSFITFIEGCLNERKGAAREIAMQPKVIEEMAGDGWKKLVSRAASDETGRSLLSLLEASAAKAPDTFLEDFVGKSKKWTGKAAELPEVRQAVFSSFGEADTEAASETVLSDQSLIRGLSIAASDEVRGRVTTATDLASKLTQLRPYLESAVWRKGVRAAAKADTPSIEAFWKGTATGPDTIPLKKGAFKVASFADMEMITDEILLREEYYLDGYEKSDKPYIIDCGTNVGLAITYLKTLYPKATVLGFEPVSSIREIAEENMTSLGLDNVTILPNALAGEAGRRRLRISLDNSLAGSITDRMDRKKGRTIEEFVEAVKLSDYIKGPVDFIKMDIEGVEHEVLEDIKDKLPLVRNLFCEFHYDGVRSRQKMLDVMQILTDAGFVYHVARTPWAEARYAHRPLSYAGQAYSISIFAKNQVWPPKAGKA